MSTPLIFMPVSLIGKSGAALAQRVAAAKNFARVCRISRGPRVFGMTERSVAGTRRAEMKYALLIYEADAAYGGDDTPEMHAIMAEHGAFIGKLGASFQGGAGLKRAEGATTIRKAGAGAVHTVHDGPFAEGREQLGGFYLIDVPDLDAAIAWARQIPMAHAGAVEIRPLLKGG
jgi:hypothetical protein